MSDSIKSRPMRVRLDRGMTLPELLVCVTMMGLIVTVLSSAIVVTLRQQSSTEGRLNVARAEQSVGLWMPADLSSADEVDTDPGATPCGASMCQPGDIDLSRGSNVVMMTWTVDSDHNGNGLMTKVSYHFTPTPGTDVFELWRVECVAPYKKESGVPILNGGWTCNKLVALRDLQGPPNDQFGNPVTFQPGVTSPTWVIRVSEPLAPAAVAGPDGAGEIDPSKWKDANRVIVTIDGGGSAAGAGGGRNQISITAGGTNREDIASTSMVGSPSFVAARSRCGGPITLVIDESQSIGTNINTVRDAVRQFINTLRGTPVQVQIVTFTEVSRVLGGTGGQWHKYYDMTDPTQATALYNAAADIKLGGAGGSGYTNWEEALFRTGFNADGTVATGNMPHTVVFFTDGIPTRDRSTNRTPSNAPNPVGYPTSVDAIWPKLNNSFWGSYPYGSAYHQVSYNRAEWIASVLRSKTKLIAVGVGPFGSTDQSDWRFGPGKPVVKKKNKDILADLITGGVIIEGTGGNIAPEAVLGTIAGQPAYVNSGTARLYIPNWSLLPTALRSVALGECAGTITFQTRLAVPDGSGAYPYLAEPVRYIAKKVTNPDGSASPEQNKYVETNIASTARTFDLSVPSGEYVDVDVIPMDFSTLNAKGHTTHHWECTVAGVPVTNLPEVQSGVDGWSGFSLRITANGAASCTHYVNPP